MDIFTACIEGNRERVRELLNDPDMVPNNFALIQASVYGHDDIVGLLLNDSLSRFDPGFDHNRALYWACINDHVNTVRVLLGDPRVNAGDNHNYILADVCFENNATIVKLLLSNPRVNAGDNHNMALCNACEYGRNAIVPLLLANPRVDPSDNQNEAIVKASTNGHLDIVRLLMADPRVNPADNGDEAIFMASRNGHIGAVRLLLNDPRVNPVGAYYVAITEEHLDIIQLLEHDLRIAMFYNNPVWIRRSVESNTRPPRGSLAYTMGNAASRHLFDELYTEKALLLARGAARFGIARGATQVGLPFDLIRVISRYGKKSHFLKKWRQKKKKSHLKKRLQRRQ
jgi:hypothetical protein